AYQETLRTKSANAPETLTSRMTFAAKLREHNELGAAIYHCRSVLDISRKLPSGNLFTPAAQIELAAALLAQKKYAEADPLLLEAHEDLTQRNSKPSPQIKDLQGQAIRWLAQLYRDWDTKDEADSWAKKLEELKKRIEEP